MYVDSDNTIDIVADYRHYVREPPRHSYTSLKEDFVSHSANSSLSHQV
jgi:hypothetical protein